MVITLTPQPLTRAAFAPFGDVIETRGSPHFAINAGFAERFHDLANIDVAADGGRPLLSILPRPAAPDAAAAHLDGAPPAGQPGLLSARTTGTGSSSWPPDRTLAYRMPCGPSGPAAARASTMPAAPGTIPSSCLTPDHEFLVVDRGGDGANLEEVPFDDAEIVLEL
jgi:ureidoglycolate lyase